MAKKEEVENMINQLAIEYYNARKIGNKAQETKLWSELYKILAVPESPNPVNRILNKKIKLRAFSMIYARKIGQPYIK